MAISSPRVLAWIEPVSTLSLAAAPATFSFGVFVSLAAATRLLCTLSALDDAVDAISLLLALPNQCGNPWRRLNPPGGKRSSSVALTGSSVEAPVLNVYVVRGTINGWNTSVEKVTSGGRSG